MGNIILTGDRPTGKLHIGHYIGSLKNRVLLQNQGDYDEYYIMIADAQALGDNADNIGKIRENIREVACDYLACGIDPNKVTIFIQSMVPELTELTFYYMDLVTYSRLVRNPTVKEEIKQKEANGQSLPVGFMCYPISQAADITAFDANIVPVGNDQEPMLEQTRDIVRTFNTMYGPTLVEPKSILPENKDGQRLVGTDGKAKMSKSLGNCIYLSDDADTVRAKVMSMYTDPDHIKVSDPGKVEGNVVFTYLRVFASDADIQKYAPGYNNVAELEAHYKRGGLGDVMLKRTLANILNDILEPIRTRRKYYEEHTDEVYKILFEGSAKARVRAQSTLRRVKKAMGIDYEDSLRN